MIEGKHARENKDRCYKKNVENMLPSKEEGR